MKERIGVYICHCGGNISDYVDVEELSRIMKDEDGVVVSKHVMFACADSGQKEMVQDIQEQNLDALVVASCSPKLHLHTFRGVAKRANLNQYNYIQVNIREQCSWPHSDKPLDATKKAAGLIRAGIKRAALSKALENIEIDTTKAVVVIGAGISGMRASIDLAKMGNEVYLIEKDFFVGGNVAQSDTLFMDNEKGKDLTQKLYQEIKSFPNITLFTGSTIEKVSGSLGNFNVSIKIRPTFIKHNADIKDIKQAIEECKTEAPDNFTLGLTNRKAIYKNYAEALPDKYVVDAEAIKEDHPFLEKYNNVIDIYQFEETVTLHAGSILVTTGADFYKPKENEYAYKSVKEVITLAELKTLISLNSDKLFFNNKPINTITFIYCVGNRQTKGENKYCSRYCCTSAIHTSILLKEKYNNIKSYHLFRDIRTYGKQEILYEKSSKQGDVYIRFDEKEPPTVEIQNGVLTVKVKDLLTSKKELEIGTDLVVLVTGMIAREDSFQIAEKLKIPIGNDKFFNEIHPKLKPVETVIKGVFISGCCQGPKNISESVQSSLSAAAKISASIKSNKILLEPVVAMVDAEKCLWCGKCAEVCEYDAINERDNNGKKIALVNKATCTGCGICAPVCPTDAIHITQYSNEEIESMIDGFAQEVLFPEKTGVSETDKNDKSTKKLGMQRIPKIWTRILESVKDTPKAIHQIAAELNEPSSTITYHVMTMNKYNMIESAGLDKKEMYHLYKQKN